MKWKEVAEKLAHALTELDSLTHDGDCACNTIDGYVCVSCQAEKALKVYNSKCKEEQDLGKMRKFNNNASFNRAT